MTQDTKCFFGLHKYELIKEENVCTHVEGKKDDEDGSLQIIGTQYVSRCTNCGKIKAVFVPTDTKYINRSTRA